MSDVKPKALDMLQQLQMVSLATVTEDGKPWTRYVMCKGAEDMSLRIATFIGARKVKQIEKNPEVHITCGITDPTVMKPYLQIQARAELVTTAEEKAAGWFDHLAQIFKGPDDPNYGVLVMKPYRIELCTPGSFKPEVWEA